MKLILLGPPGAGKGTQAEILSKRLGIPAISTGNILRAAMKNGTTVGLEAKAYVESGALVPDEVIIGIVQERVAQPDCENGFILDGMPRTIAQAEALERHGFIFDAVLHLDVTDEVVLRRLTGRRTCTGCGAIFHLSTKPPLREGECDICGSELVIRKDDAPETVKARLAIYHAETKPLEDFYAARGMLRTLRDRDSITQTSEVILEMLGS